MYSGITHFCQQLSKNILAYGVNVLRSEVMLRRLQRHHNSDSWTTIINK